jgi:hypothetical protein
VAIKNLPSSPKALSFIARLLLWGLVSFRAVSYSAWLHLAPSPNTLRRTRRRGMKIGLPKITNSLCSNNLKKLSWYIIYYR